MVQLQPDADRETAIISMGSGPHADYHRLNQHRARAGGWTGVGGDGEGWWGGMGWDGMGWDGMGWDRIGSDRIGWDGMRMGLEGMGLDGFGGDRLPVLLRGHEGCDRSETPKLASEHGAGRWLWGPSTRPSRPRPFLRAITTPRAPLSAAHRREAAFKDIAFTHAETPHLLFGQVYAPQRHVRPHVTHDVDQLHGHPKGDRGLPRPAEWEHRRSARRSPPG